MTNSKALELNDLLKSGIQYIFFQKNFLQHYWDNQTYYLMIMWF